MTFLMIVLLFAIAAATGLILADSGLRLWSAVGAIRAQQGLAGRDRRLPALRDQRAPRVTTRVSFAEASGPLRAAA